MKGPGWRDLTAGHFQHLVILPSRHAGSEMQISTDALSRVAISIQHIECRYNERNRLDELAKFRGLSERTFYRVFRQATGQTPLSYLKNFRIERRPNTCVARKTPSPKSPLPAGLKIRIFLPGSSARQAATPPPNTAAIGRSERAASAQALCD
jgi:hypothetical protein